MDSVPWEIRQFSFASAWKSGVTANMLYLLIMMMMMIVVLLLMMIIMIVPNGLSLDNGFLWAQVLC